MALDRNGLDAALDAYASIADATPLPTWVLDRAGRVRLWNAESERVLGWHADEVIGSTPPSIPQADWPSFELQFRHALAGETVTGVESRCQTRGGDILEVRVAAAPLREPGGDIVGVVRTLEDVSDRKRREEVLRGQAALLDLTADAILVRSFDTDIIRYWNRGAEELYGFTGAEAIGRVSHDLLHTVHPTPLNEAKESLVLTGRWEGELVHIRRDGSQLLVASRWALQSGDGGPEAILESNTDITARVRSERERQDLLRSEQRARAALEDSQLRLSFLAESSELLASSLDYEITLNSVSRLAVSSLADWCVIHIVDPDGEVRQIVTMHPDPAKVELVREFDRRNPYDPNAPDGVARVIRTGEPELIPEITEEMLATPGIDPERLRLLRLLGFRSFMAVPMLGREGVVGVISFVGAESGRHYATDDLALGQELARRAAIAVENARLYREVRRVAIERSTILAQMADGVAIVNASGQITYRNEAAQRLRGNGRVTPSVAESVEVFEVRTVEGDPYPLDQTPIMRALRDRITTTDARWLLRRADGTDITVEGSAVPLIGEDGEVLGAVSTFRDITAQRSLEQQKDDFLSAAAHDLRTPLTSLKGVAQLLQRQIAKGRMTQPDQLLEGLGRIERNATRMASLVEELLDLTQLQMGKGLDLNRRPTDIVALVARAIDEQRDVAGDTRINVHADVPELVGMWDIDRLERVIANLLSNAVKYSPKGASIDITVGEHRDASKQFAVVSVQDHGIGIPADDLPHIFDRFHRGRNVGHDTPGTGIGLAGTSQIIEQHGGTIEVETREGIGSTFTVRLPLDDPKAMSREP